jgi:hypothetical protein
MAQTRRFGWHDRASANTRIKSEIVARMPKHWICLNLFFSGASADSPAQSTAVFSLVVATSIGFAVIIRYLGGLSFAAVTESAVQGHYPVLRERQLPPFRGGSKTIHRKYDEDATGRKQPWSSYLKWSITVFQRNPRSVKDLKYCTNFMQRLKQPRLSSIRLHWPRVFNKVIHQSGDDSENCPRCAAYLTACQTGNLRS